MENREEKKKFTQIPLPTSTTFSILMLFNQDIYTHVHTRAYMHIAFLHGNLSVVFVYSLNGRFFSIFIIFISFSGCVIYLVDRRWLVSHIADCRCLGCFKFFAIYYK